MYVHLAVGMESTSFSCARKEKKSLQKKKDHVRTFKKMYVHVAACGSCVRVKERGKEREREFAPTCILVTSLVTSISTDLSFLALTHKHAHTHSCPTARTEGGGFILSHIFSKYFERAVL